MYFVVVVKAWHHHLVMTHFHHSSYIPTRLWGFSGHVQTILQSLIGRVKCPWPLGERVYLKLHDGSTLTYDLYQPIAHHHDEEITVAVCPGVGNSSESVYIRTFVHYAQCHGYRIAVLNHIGVIDSIQVTSPRIFTYGEFFLCAKVSSLKVMMIDDLN
jgi:abhydrolase domain-containing protein 2